MGPFYPRGSGVVCTGSEIGLILSVFSHVDGEVSCSTDAVKLNKSVS